MTFDLDQSQIDQYLEQGFFAAPGLISAADIATLNEDALRIARGGYPCEKIEPLEDELSDTDVLGRYLCIHQPHHISPVMREFMNHPGICKALSQIVGAHLRWWDGRVKCMQSMLFTKPPGFQGNPWHQDEAAIPTRDRSLTGAWIALDDTTVENGCLLVIPGSHQTGYLHFRYPTEDLDEYDDTTEARDVDESAAVPVEVKAGTVVFFNGYLMHGSKKNRSDGFRRALVYHYCNAWSLLPWRHASGLADYRGVTCVVGDDPYEWRGTEPLDPDQIWLRPCRAMEERQRE
tara:strand:- start:71 stop:940 length:870 start_codon:yes stop_codon:yes gene_type:complete